jgi:hypothetical protein
MKQSSLTSAQPAVSVAEINDPTAAGAGIELIEQDAVQLQPMSLRARRFSRAYKECFDELPSDTLRRRP